ncbi:OLC1v1005453C1 [Oldenlandia corymbosa var. corymbosa]|uniref:OLC1v1005453C1 n=1 Tax=Oldenlandia corymbosa var. corymbosa TaxID=529605 RepID=A0AAV1DFC1_OLDCO|nr:OLC1v1005453C1 [Oldenlandia corymbosa var. corymbosa]
MWRGEDYIRLDDEVSEIPEYGEGSGLVTVKIHHSGSFVTNKTRKLVFFQVEVDYFDEVKSEDLKLEEEELASTLRPSSSADPAAPFIIQNHDVAEPNNTDVASTLHPSCSADLATPFIVQNHDVAEPNNTDDSLSSNQQQHQNMDQLEQDSNQTPSADERSPKPEATITNVTLSGNLDDHEEDVVILPTAVTSPAANKAIKNRKKSAPSTPKRTSARLAAVKVRFDADGHGSSPEKAI